MYNKRYAASHSLQIIFSKCVGKEAGQHYTMVSYAVPCDVCDVSDPLHRPDQLGTYLVIRGGLATNKQLKKVETVQF